MAEIALAAPIEIPSPPSRTPTPRPPVHYAEPLDLGNVDYRDVLTDPEDLDGDGPSTPAPRGRSDTMSTASSTGTSPYLQTPETPSILSVLVYAGHHDDPKARIRQDSYGFSSALSSGSRERQENTVFEMDDSPPPPTARESFEIVEPESRLAWSSSPITVAAPLPTPSWVPLRPSTPPPDANPPAPMEEVGAPQDTLRTRVRRRLERSRSSFRSLVHRDGEDPSTDTDEDPIPNKKGRLRSFIAKLPRSNSAASLLSLASNASAGAHHAPPESPALLSGGAPLTRSPGAGVLARDYAVHDYFNPPPSSGQGGISLTADELAGPLLIKPRPKKSKGKARALSPKRLIRRPSLLSMPSSLPPPPPLSPISAVSDLDSPVLSALPSTLAPPRVDLFGSMLPRELKIQIFRTLSTESARVARGKWEGRAGGLRELIRISRVSKEWQALALDGQLWPLMHLAPFASVLPPSTFSRIITSSRAFITSLSLRGMDNLAGADLISALMQYDPTSVRLHRDPTSYGLRLPSLTHLDLRGCKSLDSHHLASLILQSPRLRHVNLKGVQDVSSEVIRTIARYSCLHHLDVSRCWDLTLGDMAIYISLLDDSQAAALRSLRIAGIKSYGHNASELLPSIASRLFNLEMLDLGGCTHVFTMDLQRFAQVYADNGQVAPLRHLILSGCTSLTSDALSPLIKRLPQMENLELAAMPDLFRDADPRSTDFEKLLKSMPSLTRLDLEGTGAHGGVTDRLLDALTPGRYGDPEQVGKELVELRIGYAKNVTPEAIIRLIRGCTKLRVLEVDNTGANNAVMREFLRRRRDAEASLSLIDCRAITPASYGSLASATRARRGWVGHAGVPFGYDHAASTLGGAGGELAHKPVLKTFWSWRRVGVPPGWREALAAAEAAAAGHEDVEVEGSGDGQGRMPVLSRRGSGWWRGGDEDERAGCIIM